MKKIRFLSPHEARTEGMFDVLLVAMFEVWTKEGEGKFAVYFRRHYGTGVWKRWWYGAALVPGVSANQNPKESGHARQKAMLGRDLMANAPLILAAEGACNDADRLWPATSPEFDCCCSTAKSSRFRKCQGDFIMHKIYGSVYILTFLHCSM